MVALIVLAPLALMQIISRIFLVQSPDEPGGELLIVSGAVGAVTIAGIELYLAVYYWEELFNGIWQ